MIFVFLFVLFEIVLTFIPLIAASTDLLRFPPRLPTFANFVLVFLRLAFY